VYDKHKRFFNQSTRDLIESGDDVFKFPGLKMTKTTDESRAIPSINGGKIIIAGSGMSNGGRIIHHEKRCLDKSSTTLLLIGYQAAGTLGRQILDGAKIVNILGTEVPVRARVVQISGYSAHKDSDGLLDFVRSSADTLHKVYCVLGEPKSSMALAQKIRDNLGIPTDVPHEGDKVILK